MQPMYTYIKLPEKQFRTSYIDLATSLIVLGHEIISCDKDKEGKFFFIFEENQQLLSNCSNFFNKKLYLDINRFIHEKRSLKNLINYNT